MIAHHNDIATPEDFLEYLACDEKSGLQNHEFFLKVPDDESSFRQAIVEDNFEMMDGSAVPASVEPPAKDVSQPELCSICEQARNRHKQFQTCQVCYSKRKQEDIFMLVECSHEFCQPCLKSYLENLVRECNIGKLKCL